MSDLNQGEFNLNGDDVVDMYPAFSFAKAQLCTFTQLKQGLHAFLRPVTSDWLDSGVECRILRVSGGGWQKGKLRLRLEFVPDEPPPVQTTDAVLSPNNPK